MLHLVGEAFVSLHQLLYLLQLHPLTTGVRGIPPQVVQKRIFHVDNVVPSHQDDVATRVDSGGVPEHLSHLQG